MKKFILMLTILVQVSVVFSQHFEDASDGGSTAYMNIYIKEALINGVGPLVAGDEIAVFDGNICCGVVVLTGTPSVSTPAEIVAGANDGGSNGFTDSKKMYFRYWDSSESKEYTNVIASFDTGTELSSTFLSGGTAVLTITTENVTISWIGLGPFPLNSWSYDFNWSGGKVPEPNSDVIISGLQVNQPLLDDNDVAFCGSITFQDNPTLTIQSSAAGTGSLIVAADITGTATVNSNRYMTGNAWHLIASPLSGQTVGSFLTTNPSVSAKDPSRGMMDYNESSDVWNPYFENSNGDNISPGKGYGIRTDAASSVTFLGSLSNGDVTASVTRTPDPGNGWNLIGNPYTSAIYTRQEVFGFLTVNAGDLDPSYTAIYLWDQDADAYTIINSSEGDSKLASGQGFFVKAASSGSVNFTQAMQVHQTDAPFKSAVIPNPNVVLTAKSGDIFSSTKVNFIEEMTLGLDPSYDAGILRSTKGLDIYSRLVTDNGVDFAVQALPGKSSDSYIIPIGIDAVKGGEIVLSAQSLNLPVGYDVMIEDKLTNTLTNINNGELYVTELAANSKGVGRFYLHVGSSVQTGLEQIQQDDITVYTIDQNLYVKGAVGKNAQFMVYSVDGRLMNRFGATSQNLNQFSIAGYSPGIYLINVSDNNKYKSLKFVVGK